MSVTWTRSWLGMNAVRVRGCSSCYWCAIRRTSQLEHAASALKEKERYGFPCIVLAHKELWLTSSDM